MTQRRPRNLRRWAILASLLLCALAAYFAAAYRHLWLAEWAFLRGDWTTAQLHASSHLKDHQQSRRALLLLARSARRLDDPLTAEQIYQRIDPLPLDDLRWLADHYRGNPRSATRLLRVSESILDRAPNDPAALLDIARVFDFRRDDARARRYAQRAVDADPTLVPAWELLAELYYRDVQPDKQAECLRRAIALDPPHAWELRMGLAAVLLNSLNQPRAAQEQIEAALEGQPPDAAILRLLADCLRIQARPDDARRHLRRALEIGPKDTETLVALADLEVLHFGDCKQALDYANRALEINAGDKRAADIRAYCLALRDRGAAPPAGNGAAPRPLPPVRWQFTDIAARAGVHFTHHGGENPNKRYLPESFASGVALIDFDSDGLLDIYLIHAKDLDPADSPNAPPGATKKPGPPNELYRNRGGGSFEKVPGAVGLGDPNFGHGAAVGDFDNDGHPDLYLCNYGPNRLYRNRGDGSFADVTAAAGVPDPGMSTSAAWFDYDEDGDLDLYVCNYSTYDVANPIPCTHPDIGPIYCGPSTLPGQRDTLYRNNGDGTFTDVTVSLGIARNEAPADLGRGLGVVAAHLNENARDLTGSWHIDLAVANDTSPNFLFLGDGKKLLDASSTSGFDRNADQNVEACMGIAVGDVDGDGDFDLLVTNQWTEKNTLYLNEGGHFLDASTALGLAYGTKKAVGWGTALLDFDNDGDLDNFVANGHFYDWRPTETYRQKAMLWVNRGDGFFEDFSQRAGPYFQTPRLGRGAAFGDLDNDGRLDIVVNHWGEPAALLRNDTQTEGAWIRLDLVGTQSNRDAVGTVVRVRVGTRYFYHQRAGGGSYLSASDPRVHVGLGSAEKVDELEIRWPGGTLQRFTDLEVNRPYRLVEGSDLATQPVAE